MRFNQILLRLKDEIAMLRRAAGQQCVPDIKGLLQRFAAGHVTGLDSLWDHEILKRMEGRSLPELENRFGRPDPCLVEFMIGEVKRFYLRYYAIELLRGLANALDWYRDMGSFFLEDNWDTANYFARNIWMVAGLTEEETECYANLSQLCAAGRKSFFDFKERGPDNDESIRCAFTEAFGMHDKRPEAVRRR